MAYRGNSSNDGGCLATIIAFFVLFFLPAWVAGDDFGWGVLIIWWIILAFICWLIYECSKPASVSNNYQQQNRARSTSSNVLSSEKMGLPLSKSNLNKSLTSKYNAKIELKRDLENEVRELSDLIGKKKLEIEELNKKNIAIENYADKPLLMSKKKYMSKMLPLINENTEKVKALEENIELMRKQIDEKQRIASTMKFALYEESNQEFEALKKAFDIFKKSCKIEGTMNIKGSEVSTYQRQNDLCFIEYRVPPYCISLGGSRFYIFPNSILVFEGEGKLIGIYMPKVMEAKFEHKENIKYSYRNYDEIAEDTKIITKDIPHTTWLHTCRDGSPDLRYSHNPKRTYYTQQEYYLECNFELVLCGYTLKYKVSSYDNCEILQKAIKKYSAVRANIDIIPIILDLLERCTDGSDVAYINKKIMGN